MDVLSLLGMLVGFSAILGGNFLEGGELKGLCNGAAFVIVVGGTLGAAMIQTPLPVFRQAVKILPWVWKPPDVNLKSGIEKIIGWSQSARRDGLLGLEAIVENESDTFLQKGLQMLVDGSEPESIRHVLETELILKEYKDIQAAKVF